jgi:ribonuclease-3
MPAPERDLSELEKRIRYSFQNPEILRTALRHKSALEGKAGACNDRLEWLGDAVIGLFIADYLFQNYDRPRSWLSLVKAKWVSEECLAYLARKIGLEQFIELGRGEERSGGREKDSILSSAFEALAGAIFVDSLSYERTREVLSGIFCNEEGVEFAFLSVNYKGLLQRWCLQYFSCLPEYEIVTVGDNSSYQVVVKIQGRVVARGEGKSKKRAEQEAARRAWERIMEESRSSRDGQCI